MDPMPVMPPEQLREALFLIVTPFVFIFGACIGSFLNVCIWRLPRGESLVHPPSHCPKCNHAIRAWENLPLLSWLCLRGRCSQCGLPISIRYPLVELATALLFLAVWLQVFHDQQPWGVLPGYFYLFGALLAITFTDIEHRIIPNAIVLPGLLIAVVLALVFPEAHLHPDPGGEAELVPGIFTSGLLALSHVETAPRWSVALLDSLFGMGLGASILLAFRWAGGICWGAKRNSLPTPCRLRLTAERLSLPGVADDETLDDFFATDRDALHLTVTGLQLQLRPSAKARGGPQPQGAVALTLTPDGLHLQGAVWPLEQLEKVEAEVTHCQTRLEVLGLGDVKLMAMIGAFLGPDPVIFVMLLSALAGSVWGGVAMAARRRLGGHTLCYGPFIALGVVLWFFFGNWLVLWYGRAILGLHSGV